jgi:flagellar hook-associated protein 3 FlgL
LDMVEAASRLSRQTTTLEAAQASFVRVQNLSIFNFLR